MEADSTVKVHYVTENEVSLWIPYLSVQRSKN